MSALRNGRLRRLVIAYAGSAASEWSSWLAVLVYAEQRGGSAAAGWAALGLLVPAVIVAPFVGRISDSARPILAVGSVYAAQGVTLAVAALLAAAEAPLLAVAVPAALAIGGISVVRPSYAVMAPAVVRTARELTAANLFAGYCDSGAVLLGPIIATAFLALGGPAAVLAACAALAVIGVACTASMFGLRRPDALHDEAVENGGLRDLVRSVRSRPSVPALLGVLGTQHVLMGFIGPMFVILATDELSMGSSGAGVLNIAFGVGAVASAVSATVLCGRTRLAPVVALCLGAAALSLGLIGAVAAVPVAVVALAAAGLSRSLLDVTARMLLQRSAPPEYLARVFAFIEVLTSVGLAAGTALAQLTTALLGPRGAFGVMAALPAFVLVLLARAVWRADAAADVPVVAIALFRHNPVFAALPPAALEGVARAAVERHVAAGETLIREGDPGDGYFVVSAGRLRVEISGRQVNEAVRPDGVGEVALLSDVPRTASVIAAEDSVVFEIDRDPFLLAVTGHEAAHAAAWSTIATYQR